jgi:energy-coupling factor transport system permease protein
MSMLVPSYRRTGSALHRTRIGVALAYVGVPCGLVVAFDHPLVLGAVIAAVIAAGVAAGVGRELARAARLALPLALLVALVNPLVSREGLTVLVQGPVLPVLGSVDITLEAIVYGAATGLRVIALMLGFALYSAVVDPDDLLRLVRRVSFRSALTASLATRLVPVLARDAERLAVAYALRASAPVRAEGGLRGVRRGALLTRSLAAGALERAVELAAALEVRGYSAAPRRSRRRERRAWSREDFSFALAAIALAAAGIAALAAGAASFDPYPELTADFGAAEVLLAAVVPTAMAAPFVRDRRERRRGLDG